MKNNIIVTKLEEIENEISLYDDGHYYSLFLHECGIIIFYVTLFKHKKKVEYISRIEKILQKIINHIDSTDNLKENFAYGIIGIVWTFEYLKQNNIIDSKFIDEDFKLYIDELNQTYMRENNFDVMYGLIGSGLLTLSSITKNENEIINYFVQNKIEDKYGWKWRNNINHAVNDNYLYNIGLAHGIPSVISFCALLITNDKIKTKKKINEVREIIRNATSYLISRKQINTLSFFSTTENFYSPNTRLAWCYGDLGISIALWQSGVALQDEAIKQEAIDICLHTTKRRTPEETGVVDAGICHGTAGIAHIYNRMYRYTKRKEFKEAADYWIEETLKMATHKDGLAGYKAWQGKELGWQNEYGLLEGIAGIGLVLLSHISDEEPTWDRCLLLS